jgi:hypothetical protein
MKTTIVGSTVSFAKYQEFKRPAFTDTLHFPNDVTQLGASNVSDLLSKYTALYAFANAEMCRANVMLLRLDTAESLRRASLLRQQPTLNAQERWRRDTILDCDQEVGRIIAQRAQAKEAREIAQTARDNFDRYISALSRELSRKSFESKQ